MLAIDTNVIVRYLTGDHPEQSPRARAMIEANPVHMPATVLLETGWVLGSVYGHGRAEVARALRAFAGLPTVSLERPETAARALDWLEGGMDFADAMHLAAGEGCAALASFDAALARVSRRLGALPVRKP